MGRCMVWDIDRGGLRCLKIASGSDTRISRWSSVKCETWRMVAGGLGHEEECVDKNFIVIWKLEVCINEV